MPDARKPPGKIDLPPMQKRHPRTVHFSDLEWESIREVARRKLLEPTVFVRFAAMTTAKRLKAQAAEEESFGMLEAWR